MDDLRVANGKVNEVDINIFKAPQNVELLGSQYSLYALLSHNTFEECKEDRIRFSTFISRHCVHTNSREWFLLENGKKIKEIEELPTGPMLMIYFSEREGQRKRDENEEEDCQGKFDPDDEEWFNKFSLSGNAVYRRNKRRRQEEQERKRHEDEEQEEESNDDFLM